MSEIEKLYQNAGIKYYTYVVDTFPPIEYPQINFTAEKQLELIKWLAYKTIKIVRYDTCFYVGTKFKPCIENGGCFAGCEEIELTEALAELINNLWQDLTDTEKAEIRRILE